LFNQVQTAEHAGRVTYYERHDRATGVVHRFRFVNDVPLNASRATYGSISSSIGRSARTRFSTSVG
jgi:hypothetical protein